MACAHTPEPLHEPARCTLERPSAPLELVVLGSGGPGSFGRAASGYLVLVDGVARMLVDVGPGVFLRLGELGVDIHQLDTVLLTHLHIDHAGDLPGFIKARDLIHDESMDFHIFGPEGGGPYPGTTVFVERLFGSQGAFAYLPTFRNEIRFETSDLPIAQTAAPHQVLRTDALLVTSIAVDHGDVPAVAYRIEHAGQVIVISGDLAAGNDNLVRLARGAHVLVHDTAVLDPPGSPGSLYHLHTAPRRIGEIAAAAHVRSLVLSHLSPAVERAESQVLQSVREKYAGDVRFARDCLQMRVVEETEEPPA